MLQTISRFAGFGSFPIIFLLLGTTGLLLVRLFPALGEALTGVAEAITQFLRGLRIGLGPLGLILLPLELLWNLLKKILALLWALLQQLLDWILAFLQWLFGLFDGDDEVGCGCAPAGCLMIPFALVAKLFGVGGDDGGSGTPSGGGGGSSFSAPQRDPVGAPQHSKEKAREPTASRETVRKGRRERKSDGIPRPTAVGAPSGSRTTGGVRSRSRNRTTNKTPQRQRESQRSVRMVGKSASIPKKSTGTSRVRDAVSGMVGSAKDTVAGAAGEVKDNVKAAVGASTDPDYFGDVPDRPAFASAWTIDSVEDARDIAEILAERGIEHSWQIDETTGLPTVTIPNHVAGRATDTLGEYGFDVGEGMPADYISVDRVHEAPDAGTVYDPETDEWVTPEPEWNEDDTVPALEDRVVYDPDAGTLYDPAMDAHFDEETQGWYGADGEPVAPDAEYTQVEEDSEGTHPDGQPALPAPSDDPNFVWGPHPEPVPVGAQQDEDADEVIDAPHVE